MLLKYTSNRNLLSGVTLTSGQEPCGLTGTSLCFRPRCLRFKFPLPIIVTMLNDQKSGVKLTSVTWMLVLGVKTANCPRPRRMYDWMSALSGHSFLRLEEFLDTFRWCLELSWGNFLCTWGPLFSLFNICIYIYIFFKCNLNSTYTH